MPESPRMNPARPTSARAAAGKVIERWSLPDVDGPVLGQVREEHRSAMTEEVLRAALQEGDARGYQEGVARAQRETQSQISALEDRVKRLDSVLQLLSRPLDELDAQVEKELVHLALAIGKQLARRELRVDPAQVIGIIRELLGQLPSGARDVRVHLHPEDASIVRDRLSRAAVTVPGNERAWNLVEDPTLARGGCLVRSETSQIDARVESRIGAVVANAFGDLLGEERALADRGGTWRQPEADSELPERESEDSR